MCRRRFASSMVNSSACFASLCLALRVRDRAAGARSRLRRIRAGSPQTWRKQRAARGLVEALKHRPSARTGAPPFPRLGHLVACLLGREESRQPARAAEDKRELRRRPELAQPRQIVRRVAAAGADRIAFVHFIAAARGARCKLHGRILPDSGVSTGHLAPGTVLWHLAPGTVLWHPAPGTVPWHPAPGTVPWHLAPGTVRLGLAATIPPLTS